MSPRRVRRDAFRTELAMLRAGRTLVDVIVSLCGSCSRGRAWQGRLHSMLGQLPTAKSRRAVLQHFLRLFSGAQRHGAMWRVRDWWGYLGRQHRDRIDPETGEVRIGPRGKPSCHVPKAEAGGMSALENKSARQLQRYREHMRASAIMGSQKTPFDAVDAVRPRTEGSCWAYAQHWMVGAPSPAMLAKLDGVVSPETILADLDPTEAERAAYLGVVLAGEHVELARLRRRREWEHGIRIAPSDVPY